MKALLSGLCCSARLSASSKEWAKRTPSGSGNSSRWLRTMFSRFENGRYFSGIESHVLPPIITVPPLVILAKCLRSAEMCQGKSLFFPIPRLRSIAAMMENFFIIGRLDGDFKFDKGIVFVIDNFEVFVSEFIDWFFCYFEGWEFFWCASELFFHAFDVVEINVCVADCVGEDSRFKVTFLSDHLHESCVRCDVEWHTESNVCAALIELAV